MTDASGAYQFTALLPGVYAIKAELQGFQPARNERVEVRLGQVLTSDLSLAIAGVAESVQVTAESPLIDVKQSASFANTQREFIENISRGRDFTSVVTVAPGANNEQGLLGGISIDGASGAENRFIIDGTDTTDLQTGESGKPLLTDFVDGVQVKSSGFAAEFGGGTDRPHQFKAFGFYQWPWGTTTGLNFYAASGTPITREASVQTVPVQYLGRGSDGRTPVFNQTDLYLAHNFSLAGDNRIQVSMNVLNLFDQKIAREYFNDETRQDVSVDLADYFAGRVDIQRAIARQDIERDPRFLMASVFQAPRSVRFAVKYIF